MKHEKPPLRTAIIAAFSAVAAAGASVLSAAPATAAATFPGDVLTITHGSPDDSGVNLGLFSTEKFPGYPFHS